MRLGGGVVDWCVGGGGLFCLLLMVANMAAAQPLLQQPPAPPSSSLYDYDSARDLYEALLRREAAMGAGAVGDGGGGFGRVRKTNNRSPSLRLRFGKRPDPAPPLNLYQLERGLLQSEDIY